MSELIAKVEELLGDGEWHALDEVADKTKIPMKYVRMLMDFLAEYKFVDYDERKKKVRAKTDYLELLAREHTKP